MENAVLPGSGLLPGTFAALQRETLFKYFQQIPLAVAIFLGEEQVFHFVNEAYCRLMSVTAADVMSRGLYDVYPEFRGSVVEQTHRSVLQTGQSVELTEIPTTFRREGDFATGYYNVKVEPLKRSDGSIEGLMTIGYDVSSQVLARKRLEDKEKALLYRKQLLETVTENTTLALFLMDDRQHCIYMNEAAEEMTGYTLAELQGKQLHYYIHHTHPDGRPYPLGECPIDRALPQKRREQGEETFVHRDGTFYPVAFTASPIEINGQAVGTVIEVRNISEEKKAAEALQESERRFRTLADTLPQLVWMTDKAGNQEYASSRWKEYTGIDPVDEATWRQMVHPDDFSIIGQAWTESLLTGTAYKNEVRLRSHTGEYRWYASSGVPVKNDAGEISNWIGALVDIHDQKTLTEKLEALVSERTSALHETNESLSETNKQLRLANKELESFTYVASHDLQEPLRKIQTFIGLLKSADSDEQKAAQYLDRIDAAAKRMSALIQSTLNYSRLSGAEAPLVPTDLNLILQQVKSDLELVIDEKGARIESDNLPVIPANPLQMSQLFSNLIGNSLKFSREKPFVQIRSSVREAVELELPGKTVPGQRFVVLEFRDNGIGFDQKYVQRIFTLFQRLHTRQAYSGTGIGLSICKRIVENHNGHIFAEGRPGEGASFWVYLPVA